MKTNSTTEALVIPHIYFIKRVNPLVHIKPLCLSYGISFILPPLSFINNESAFLESYVVLISRIVIGGLSFTNAIYIHTATEITREVNKTKVTILEMLFMNEVLGV
jgi:hypothetical protein